MFFIVPIDVVHATLALDGHNFGTGSGTTGIAVAITTTVTNDVIYVSAATKGSTSVPSISSSPTLTWTQRGNPISGSQQETTWYAIWTGSGSITVTVTPAASNTGTVVFVFGISGAATSGTFDGNAVTATGTTANPSVSITTANANDFLIGELSQNGKVAASITAGTGFTLTDTSQQGGAGASGNWASGGSEDQIVSATGTYSVAFTDSSTNAWAIVGDAVKASSAQSRSVSDSFVFSDSVSRGVILSRGSSDSYTVSDSPSRTVILPRSSSDSYVMSDSVVFNKGYARSTSDSYVFSDSPTRLAVITRGLSDSFGTTETVARLLILGRALSDAYSFTESAVRSLILAASPSSSFTTTDSVIANVVLSRSTSDSFAFTDSISASVTKAGGGGYTVSNPQGMSIDYTYNSVKSTTKATSFTIDTGTSITVHGLYTVTWSISKASWVYDVTPATAGVQILSNVSLTGIGFVNNDPDPEHPFVYFSSGASCSCLGWIPSQWLVTVVWDSNSVNKGWTFSSATHQLTTAGPSGRHEWDLYLP